MSVHDVREMEDKARNNLWVQLKCKSLLLLALLMSLTEIIKAAYGNLCQIVSQIHYTLNTHFGTEKQPGNASRGPQKAHIPYRGDDPEVGKKTRIAVQHVEHKSDGFELFDELIQAPDGLTPPQRKARSESLARECYLDDYDNEYGEQSMWVVAFIGVTLLAHRCPGPMRHFVNLRPPVSPPTTIGRRSSIWPVTCTSDVDFDQIPSPRSVNSHPRSFRNGGLGLSTLSRS